ncbi:hypothetical protein HA402_009202 [Bradysia odoriphaga]|nr:hypothetical protein HA402_009202 [Bradysia odoriphaga]
MYFKCSKSPAELVYGQALKIPGEFFVDTPLTDPANPSNFVDRLCMIDRVKPSLNPRYDGPFRVVKRLRKGYLNGKNDTVSIDRLKPAFGILTVSSGETGRKRSKNAKQNAGQQQNNVQTVPAPSPPPLTRTFSDIVANNNIPNASANNYNNANEDLFSTAQLLQIFTNAIHDIRKCRTKLDQIQVITNLLSHVL